MFGLRYEIKHFLKYLPVKARTFSCSSCRLATHYQTLEVHPNCSQKEIRDAYLKLCKQYHPDTNESNPSLNEKFLRIKEAYNVLSKLESRIDYNTSIEYLQHNRRIRKDLYQNQFFAEDVGSDDPSFIVYKDGKPQRVVVTQEDIGAKRRISNSTLLIILVVVAGLSGFGWVVTIKHSLLVQERDRLNKQNGQILDNLRKMVAVTSQEEIAANIEMEYNKNLESYQAVK